MVEPHEEFARPLEGRAAAEMNERIPEDGVVSTPSLKGAIGEPAWDKIDVEGGGGRQGNGELRRDLAACKGS